MVHDYAILYVKTGCPHSKAAMDFLDEHGIPYLKKNMTEDAEAREELRKKSGQDMSPSLDYHGDLLCDFGVDELIQFLTAHEVNLEES